MRSCVPEPYVPEAATRSAEAATRSAPEAATLTGNRYAVSWWATEDEARAEGAEEILDDDEGIPENEMPYAVGNLQVPPGGVNALENNDQVIA